MLFDFLENDIGSIGFIEKDLFKRDEAAKDFLLFFISAELLYAFFKEFSDLTFRFWKSCSSNLSILTIPPKAT